MNRTWFRRMLMGYTPVFFIVIIILFLLFFQALNNQNRQEALTINESLAGQAYRYVDRSLKEVDYKVLRESLVNESFQKYLNEKDMSNVPINLKALKSLRELKVNYPIIDSIYLVRYTDQSVLSLGTIAKISEYGDHQFINSYNEQRSSQWTDGRLFREFPNQGEKEVVTLTRPVPFYSKSKGFLVVNVSLESLHKGILEMYDPEVSYVRLLDRNGNEVYKEPVNQKKVQVLTRLTSNYTGWTIESGFIKSNFSRIMESINILWLLTSIIVVIIGITWFIYITKMAYKPLEQLIRKIHSVSKEPRYEEFISSHRNYSFDHLVEQSNRYLKEQDEVLVLRKKYIFEKLLKEIGEFPEWKDEMSKIGMPEEFQPCLVFMVELDWYYEWEKKLERDQMLQLKALIEGEASQIGDETLSVLWCGWANEYRLVGIAQVSDATSDPIHFFENYKKLIATQSVATVTIGFSRVVLMPEDIRKAYQEAEGALEYKAITGSDLVIRYEESTNMSVDIYSHLKLAHEIVIAYRMNTENWCDLYRQLFNQLRKTKLRKEELVNIIYFFVYQLEREKKYFPQELQLTWCERILPSLTDQIERFDTIEELEENMLNLLNQMFTEMIALRKEKNHHQMLREIKDFIQNNYDNVDLSLDYLSEIFEIKGKYISRLFKDEFGEKFVDFLIRIRLERAEELLQTTNHTILEISEKVGYMNVNSFTRVFRKVYKTSPGEYRKVMQNSQGA
jgi:AraC-like DNA-binding protein